jgi:glycosyltransferase involved in cell wall biosynthesis
MTCDVSVIIPAFRSRFVGQAISSALQQSLLPREIILIDGSPECTREALAPFEGRLVYIEQSPNGVSAARNAGIEAATSEFVAFLDADDFWLLNKLELEINALRRFPQAGFSFSPVWNYCDQESKDIPTDPYIPKELSSWLHDHDEAAFGALGSVYSLLLAVNCVATSSVVVRRNALLQVGLFADCLNNGEDHELWLRLARQFPAVVFGRPTSRYRVHSAGLSGSWRDRSKLFYQYNSNVLERHRAQFPSWLARKAVAQNYAGHAYYLLCHGEPQDAWRMAERSLMTIPSLFALRTYFESRFPAGYAWFTRHLRFGRA